ncbi:MAG TPA: DNA repair protein RecO [Draconibacterium sp.]|nr:DNA repair protein RecO [Draconibacterium sp.]HRX10277.1 DNA repair protein RecO [Draconibacterium sp.]
MLVTTEGIVLHFIKYGESSVIVTIFTRDFGRQSYMVNAARSKKSQNKSSLLQPLFIVDLVAYQKPTNELHRIKELKSNQVYQNIPFNITKSSLVIFIAEVLYKSINEQESYPEMYDFIKNSLLYFDLMETGSGNFHLWFLFRLTQYLGFFPETNRVGFEGWFDMKKGAVVHFQPSHPFYANKEATEYLMKLSSLKLHEISEFVLSRAMRDTLITVLVDYYQLHFEDLGEIKSLNVLREVFR